MEESQSAWASSNFLQSLVECDRRPQPGGAPQLGRIAHEVRNVGRPDERGDPGPARRPPRSSRRGGRKISAQGNALAPAHVVGLARRAVVQEQPGRRPRRPAHGGSRAPARDCRSGRWTPPTAVRPRCSRAANAGTTYRALWPAPVCGKGRATTTRSAGPAPDLERREFRRRPCSRRRASGRNGSVSRRGRCHAAAVDLRGRDQEQQRISLAPTRARPRRAIGQAARSRRR